MTGFDVRCWASSPHRATGESSQDSHRVDRLGDGRLLLAVADGASSSAAPGEWARALVDAASPGWVAAQADWTFLSDVEHLRSTYQPLSDQARWFEREKFDRFGSQAALAVAVVEPAGRSSTVRGLVVGDCLLAIADRRGHIQTAWPFTAAAAFPHQPALVASRPGQATRTHTVTLRLDRDQTLLICTDFVGRRLLDDAALIGDRDERAGGWWWRTDAGRLGLESWLGRSIESHRINDDLTLISCRKQALRTSWAAIARWLRHQVPLRE